METARITHPRDRAACTGFTVVELSIGLCVLGMIGTALVGLSWGVCDGYQVNLDTQDAFISSRQAVRNVQRLLRPALELGLTIPDGRQVASNSTESASSTAGAACIYWEHDDANIGKAQLHELALIAHDRITNELKVYRLPSTANHANDGIKAHDMNDSAEAASLRALQGVQVQIIATGVTEVHFRPFIPPGQTRATMVEIMLKMTRDGRQYTQYATAALRAPSTEALEP